MFGYAWTHVVCTRVRKGGQRARCSTKRMQMKHVLLALARATPAFCGRPRGGSRQEPGGAGARPVHRGGAGSVGTPFAASGGTSWGKGSLRCCCTHGCQMRFYATDPRRRKPVPPGCQHSAYEHFCRSGYLHGYLPDARTWYTLGTLHNFVAARTFVIMRFQDFFMRLPVRSTLNISSSAIGRT